MSTKLIIALDFNTEKEAANLIAQLEPAQCALKIGNELFSLLGPLFVKKVIAQGFKVFLDLKYHDIPNTVARSCKVAADLGVWMMNVHALGGLKMMEAAKQALDSYAQERPLLIAVTVLTSMSPHDIETLGLVEPLSDYAIRLARLASLAELDGVVCSAWESSLIKKTCGQRFLTVTPGIRMSGEKYDDQTRIMTPAKAIEQGSDFLVMGRPVTRAANPKNVVRDVLTEIKNEAHQVLLK